MAMAIAISIGLREQSILAGIFMLHWCTMAFGFLVEYIAVPKYMLDTTAHWRPVGAYEMDLWERHKRPPTAVERYRNDPRALKLISQDQWNMDRPLYDVQKTDTLLATESDLYVRQQREQNYLRRMVPHVFGWFPCTAAWVIIIVRTSTQTYCHTNPPTLFRLDIARTQVHLEWAKHDLSLVSDRQIPEWVNGAIYGTVIIVHAAFKSLLCQRTTVHALTVLSLLRSQFWSFTVVQIIFQYLPPGFYWGSELLYCVLSLSAKLYLGFFLLVNVIMTDGTVEGALSPADGQ